MKLRTAPAAAALDALDATAALLLTACGGATAAARRAANPRERTEAVLADNAERMRAVDAAITGTDSQGFRSNR